MATQDEFDFESFKKEAIAGLYSGKKMTGTDWVLAPMMKPGFSYVSFTKSDLP